MTLRLTLRLMTLCRDDVPRRGGRTLESMDWAWIGGSGGVKSWEMGQERLFLWDGAPI